MSDQATPEGEEEKPERKVHVSCPPVASPGLPDRVPLKTHPSRFLGASPFEGPKRKKSLKSKCLYTWCCLVSV